MSETVKSLTFGLFLLFYYTSVRGVPGTLVGAVMSLSLIWDAFIDPAVGRISDGLPPRWGRRHAPMFVGSLIMGVAFYAVFSPPPGLGQDALLWWLIGSNLLLRTAQSAFTVPYWALGAELTSDYNERTSLTAIRTACALTGTMASAVLSFVVFFPGTRFDASNYSNMGASLGLFMTLTSLAATLSTRRFRYLTCRNGDARPERSAFLEDVRGALASKAFVSVASASGLFFLAAVLNATMAIHYLTYFAAITSSSATSIFQASFYIAALGGVALWLALSRRAEKGQVFTFATFATAAVMAGGYFLVGKGSWIGEGNLPAMCAGHAIAGIFASAVWVLPPSMMADVLDDHQLRTGKRTEGTLFGFHSLVLQLCASIALIIGGTLLDHFAHLVPGQQVQSVETARRIGMLYGLFPAVLLIAAGTVSLSYRLTRDKVAEIQALLKQRESTSEPAQTLSAVPAAD